MTIETLSNQVTNNLITPITHLTFISVAGTSTFANDNKRYFNRWWLVEKKKLLNDPEYSIVLHKREFTKFIDEQTDFPIKKISSCCFIGDKIILMKAIDTKKAFHTDATSGKKLKKMTDHVFIDFTF
jgi:hypothetical protein